MAKKKRKAKRQPAASRRDQFVIEYLVDLNATEAAKRCGYSAKTAYSQGSRLLKDAELSTRITKALADRAERVGVTADQVLARWDRRARSNAADFLTFRKAVRQTTRLVTYHEAAERVEAEISDEREVARRIVMTAAEKKGHEANIAQLERTALRYRIRSERDPEATIEVPGPAIEEDAADVDLVRLRDADRLDLVRAIQRDNDGGIKVIMHDAAQADDALGKHLGMFVNRHEHSGKNGGPIETKDVTDPKAELAAKVAMISGRKRATQDG